MTNECILQIDDDENDVFLLQHVFQRAGIPNPLRVAKDGQMAMDYLAGTGLYGNRAAHPLPCLVLLDLKLPKKSGLEVLEWVKHQPHLKKLVVVVFSSSLQVSDIEKAYELGASSYIQKPTDMQETLVIAQLLKGWWLEHNRFAPIHEPRPGPPGASPPLAGA